MDSLRALDVSSARFVELVGEVRHAQWTAPTPCAEWNVNALVGHVVTTMIIYRRLLAGATHADVVPLWADQLTAIDPDPLAAARLAAEEERRAFAQPGALERTVQHPMGAIPGSQLLAMRLSENVLHSWDLATAIDTDSHLDPAVVDLVYERVEPISDGLPETGHFSIPHGLRPSGSRLDQLVYLTGRAAASRDR